MLRSLILTQKRAFIPVFARPVAAGPVAARVLPSRNFHQSFITLKKKAKKGAKDVEEDTSSEPPLIDFDDATKRLQSVVDKFAKQANEAKLGKTNPQIFDHLHVETVDGEVPFTTLAQTAIKGRNFIITVFDPANTKHLVNAILASDLNMNPIADPSNKQLLKVPLPPVTTESKKESVKHLKTVFEKVRNGPGGSGRSSSTLAAIRADIKHKISKKKKMTDAETQVWNDYEKLHKQYVEKLGEVFKAAETAILK